MREVMRVREESAKVRDKRREKIEREERRANYK